MMIEAIKRALVDYYPKGTLYKDLTICSIATTNIVYLVFSRNNSSPDYVVRPLADDRSKRIFEQDKYIYNYVKEIVARPMGEVFIQGVCFSVHEGIAGWPWFKISHLFRDERKWNSIRELAIETLGEFDASINRPDGGLTTIFTPQESITGALFDLSRYFPEIHKKYKCTVKCYLDPLLSVQNMSFPLQHGDFCLNNLIINDSNCTVIDFEDFGGFNMPGYDAFTLAVSLNGTQPSGIKRNFIEDVKDCLHIVSLDSLIGMELVKAFYILHLLFRLGVWSDQMSREPYRQKLLDQLELILKKGDEYFHAPLLL